MIEPKQGCIASLDLRSILKTINLCLFPSLSNFTSTSIVFCLETVLSASAHSLHNNHRTLSQNPVCAAELPFPPIINPQNQMWLLPPKDENPNFFQASKIWLMGGG